MRIMYFGEPWASLIVVDAEPFPETPTWARCTHCYEPFAEGDHGLLHPTFGDVDSDFIVGVAHGYHLTGKHRECSMSVAAGHMVGVCSCTGWDVHQRATSLEVQRRVDAGALR